MPRALFKTRPTKSKVDKLLKKRANTGKTAEKLDSLRDKAYDMRLQHASYGTIAKTLGISNATAYDYVNNKHEQVLAGISQKSQIIREEQNRALDELLERWIPLAMDQALNIGEVRQNKKGEDFEISMKAWEASAAATDKVLKILDQKAKINGLMTLKVEATGDATIPNKLFAMAQSLAQSFKGQPIDAEFEKVEEPKQLK